MLARTSKKIDTIKAMAATILMLIWGVASEKMKIRMIKAE
jgi:hypothetical protein